MPIHMADLAEKALKEEGINLKDAKIAILGYAFLEDSDDTRNTPAEPLIQELKKRGVREIAIHDSFVRKEELPEVERDVYKALSGADCACLVTKHSEYKTLDMEKVAKVMRTPVIVDGRNVMGKNERFKIITIGK